MFQVERTIAEISKTFPDDGLLPIYLNPDRGSRSYSVITFGAMGDRYSALRNNPYRVLDFIIRWVF